MTQRDPRKEAIASNPDFPWLEAGDISGIGRAIERLGWLQPGERVLSADPAGEGNMNLTLRIETTERSFVLKQARPWVERYPEIPAPWDRSSVEQGFYARVAAVPAVAARMPEVFGRSPEAHIIVMEDLRGARDLSSLYRGVESGPQRDRLSAEEVDTLADYLGALHEDTLGEPDPELTNRAMRALNHEHIYVVPLDPDNRLPLDEHEPGLAAVARRLCADSELRRVAEETGRRYLADGRSLVHGDFFPGSWLRTDSGLRIIDAEFAHQGDAEVDLACAIAHLSLAAQPITDAERLLDVYRRRSHARHIDETLLARYAGIEVVRRLIGVAQLPISPTRGWRAAALERARGAMLIGDWSRLFEAAE